MQELLGNEELKLRLRQSARHDTLSHCYLLSGPSGSGKHTLARWLAAALECEQPTRPCLRCRDCRKVEGDVHPDVITVDDARKTIPVDRIRDMVADVFIRPNEGRRKVYLFPRAQDIGPAGQNALLKILEEPPPYAAFLLLAENPNLMLATIRSRCVELELAPLPAPLLRQTLRAQHPEADAQAVEAAIVASGGFLGQALSHLAGAAVPPETAAFAAALGDPLALVELFAGLEKCKRDAFLPLLLQWRQLLAEALKVQAGLPASSQEAALLARQPGQRLADAAALLQTASEWADANVSVAHLCGLLAAGLRP